MAVSRKGLWTCLLVAAVACGDRDGGREQPAPAPTAVTAAAIDVDEVSIDTADAPRGERPFIAGEAIRIGLAVRGGRGPYRVHVAVTGDGGPAVDASAELPAAGATALSARLDPAAASGRYTLTVEVTDADGARGRAPPANLDLVGEGAALVTDASPVELVDAGGRRRAELWAGERVTLRARLPGAADGPALVRLWDPAGRPLAASDAAAVRGGAVEAPLAIPRLARTGTYGVQVDSAGGQRARAVFAVRGVARKPLYRLTVENMELRGGPDGRAPITGRLPRAYPVHVEALVGGGDKQLSAVVRWHHEGGPSSATLPPADVIDAAPDGRTWVRGAVDVPKTVPSGRVHFEIEVTEGERVSSIYREMLVE